MFVKRFGDAGNQKFSSKTKTTRAQGMREYEGTEFCISCPALGSHSVTPDWWEKHSRIPSGLFSQSTAEGAEGASRGDRPDVEEWQRKLQSGDTRGIFFFCGTGDGAQGVVHARQAL